MRGTDGGETTNSLRMLIKQSDQSIKDVDGSRSSTSSGGSSTMAKHRSGSFGSVPENYRFEAAESSGNNRRNTVTAVVGLPDHRLSTSYRSYDSYRFNDSSMNGFHRLNSISSSTPSESSSVHDSASVRSFGSFQVSAALHLFVFPVFQEFDQYLLKNT